MMKSYFFKLTLFCFISQISLSMTPIPSIFEQLQFLKAIEDEKIEDVKKFLNLGYDPNFEIENIKRSESLILAIKVANIEIIELIFLFLKKDLDQNKLDTLLIQCVENISYSYNYKENVVIIKMLIEKGASVRIAFGVDGKSSLQTAIKNSDANIVNYLLDRGAVVPFNALELAIGSKNIEVIKILFTKGCCINEIDSSLISLALELIDEKDFSSLDVLLNGMSNNEVRKNFWIRILFCSDNFELIIELITKYKVFEDFFSFLNFTDEDGYSLLINATREKKINLIKFLLKNNVDVSIKDKEGKTALDHALNSYYLDTELINMLMDKNYKAPLNSSVLKRAVLRKDFDLVKLLLENNFDVNIKDEDGKTPIFHCVYDFPLMILLLEKKPNLKIKTKNGYDIFKFIAHSSSYERLNIPNYINYSFFTNSFFNRLILPKMKELLKNDLSLYYLGLLTKFLNIGFNPYYKNDSGENFIDYAKEKANPMKMIIEKYREENENKFLEKIKKIKKENINILEINNLIFPYEIWSEIFIFLKQDIRTYFKFITVCKGLYNERFNVIIWPLILKNTEDDFRYFYVMRTLGDDRIEMPCPKN